MKLVLATPLYPPEIGGPATYAAILEAGLPAHGIEVELVKFSDVRLLPKFVRHLTYYRRVRRALRNADVALALDPVSVGMPTMLAARRARKPYLVKIVGDYAWEQGRQRFGVTDDLDAFVRRAKVPFVVGALRRIERRVAERAHTVLVPSEYLKRILVLWGVPPSRIAVVYNAVPAGELGTVPEAVATLPRPLIVTAGRLVPWTRVDGIITAVAHTEASLAIVGDGPLRDALAETAHAELPGRHAFTGALSHEDTLATIASADVFALNSTYEGLSHLLIEALALGKPILATAVGGNPEVIADDHTGCLVERQDARGFAETLAALLGNAPLRTRLGVSAKAAAARFSEEAMLERTAEFLRAAAPLS
jgi:glycosyltransferase involved in cell wall biosynthesis